MASSTTIRIVTESLFSSAEVAAVVGLSQVRVNAIALKHGLGARVGAHCVFTQADVEVIRARRSWWGKRPERPPVPTLLLSIRSCCPSGPLHWNNRRSLEIRGGQKLAASTCSLPRRSSTWKRNGRAGNAAVSRR